MSSGKNTTCFLLLLFFACSFPARAQEKPYVEPTGLNNWYVELGGSGLLYSLNYEKILAKGEATGWVGRVGLGYFWKDYNFLGKVPINKGTFMAPFTTSFLWGQRKEKIEVGAGFTLLTQGISDREFVPTGVLGFRVVEMNKVCFRISYTPFLRNGTLVHWLGVSIGRNFSF